MDDTDYNPEMLDTLEAFEHELRAAAAAQQRTADFTAGIMNALGAGESNVEWKPFLLEPFITDARMFCSRCRRPQRFQVAVTHWRLASIAPEPGVPIFCPYSTPALFRLTCGDCRAVVDVIIRTAEEDTEFLVMPQFYRGLKTANTPEPVCHYLEQAARCESAGAHPMAATAYRSALEKVLKDQRVAGDRLVDKLASLKASDNPPHWYARLDADELDVLRRLGNAGVHGGGDTPEHREVFDHRLLWRVKELICEVLDEVYERSDRQGQRKAELSDRASRLPQRQRQRRRNRRGRPSGQGRADHGATRSE